MSGFAQIYKQFNPGFLVSSSFVRSNMWDIFGAPEVNMRVYECSNICLVPVVYD